MTLVDQMGIGTLSFQFNENRCLLVIKTSKSAELKRVRWKARIPQVGISRNSERSHSCLQLWLLDPHRYFWCIAATASLRQNLVLGESLPTGSLTVSSRPCHSLTKPADSDDELCGKKQCIPRALALCCEVSCFIRSNMVRSEITMGVSKAENIMCKEGRSILRTHTYFKDD